MRIFLALILTALFAITAFSQTSLKIGSSAPVFESTALDGTNYDLNALKGKVVVLTFWSTHCAICHSEIPKLNQFSKRFDEKKVVFLAITTDHDDKVSAYLKTNPFNFHILPNSFGVVLQYADRTNQGDIDMSFPSYFLIDSNGQIEYRANGWNKTGKLNSEINRLLTKQ